MNRLAVIAVLLSAALSGCAPRTAVVPAPPGAPLHPEFVFPESAEPLDGRALADHDAAWQFLQAGDAQNSERRYNALLKRFPDFYPAHAGLGYVSLSRKDHETAIAHFERALASDQAYAPALAGKGQAYLALDRRSEALAAFDAALAADPGLPGIRSTADVLRFQGLQGGVAGARQAAEAGRLAEARTAYMSAIEASPQSPFLYRELASVEHRDGRLTAARQHIETAIALDPNDARSFTVLADVLEGMGELDNAVAALVSASALEPSDALDERIAALRARILHESMPPAYREIEQASAVTRAQLAALIGVRLEALVKRAPQRNTAVITDTRGNWAAQWIIAVARAAFMEVYSNHTFQPSATVRRGDLAYTVSQILGVIAAENPRLGTAWRNARRRFPDLPPGHLRYPAASVAVEAGVMQPLDNGAFQLSGPVTGEDAVAAINRLVEVAGSR